MQYGVLPLQWLKPRKGEDFWAIQLAHVEWAKHPHKQWSSILAIPFPFLRKGSSAQQFTKTFCHKIGSFFALWWLCKQMGACNSFISPLSNFTTWPVDFGSCAGLNGGSQLSHCFPPLEWQWRHHSTVLKKKAGLARTDQIHSRHQAHLALCLSQNLSNEDHLCCACAKMLFVQGKQLLYSTSRSGPTLEK